MEDKHKGHDFTPDTVSPHAEGRYNGDQLANQSRDNDMDKRPVPPTEEEEKAKESTDEKYFDQKEK